MDTMVEIISGECDRVKELLLEKNISYGNSVADPIHIFSSLSNTDQIKVRIDDKLARLKYGQTYGNEDTTLDLIGYLILQRCIRIYNNNE